MKKTIITILSILSTLVIGSFLLRSEIMNDKSPELIEENISQVLEPVFLEESEPILDTEVIVAVGESEGVEELVSSDVDEVVVEDPLDTVVAETPKQKNILLSVPFIAQAPLGNWSDPRQQDACEEASVLMAMAWINNEKEPSLLGAEKQIIALADWQQEQYGEHRDLHIEAVASRLFEEYFSYEAVTVKEITTAEELIKFLEQGYLILVPSNGQVLKNPYFTAPGPERHLLVIIGYDYEKEMFITNDPGTRQGRGFKYPKERLFDSIRVYPSGYHEPIVSQEKLVLLVSR
jgi:hypothetical protein